MELVKVEFNNDLLEVVKVAANGAVGKVGNQYWVSVNVICKNLGLHRATQQEKLKADSTFEATFLKVETNGGVQEVFCIPLDKLNGWLFTINPNKVKPEVKQKLIAYKNECHKVLYEHLIQKATQQQPLILPENLNAMANGYKGQLKRKQNQIEKLKSELAQCRKELEKCKSEHSEANIWKKEAKTHKQRAEKAEELAEHFRKMAAYQVNRVMIFTEATEKLEALRSSFTSQASIYYEITSVVNMLKNYVKKADEYVTYLNIPPLRPKLKYNT